MKAGRIRPPGWAEAILRKVRPSDTVGRSVKADLDQEFREKVDAGSGAPRRWYAWEAIKLAGHVSLRSAADFLRGRSPRMRPGRGSREAGDVPPLGEGIQGFTRDVALALRQLRRAPAFATVAIVTLALGIAATVTIFSVVNAVLLEPLPYPDPHRLVVLYEWNQPRDRKKNVVNPGNFRAWKERTGSFGAMSAVSLAIPATVTAAGEPEEAAVRYAQPDFFQVLGLNPVVGQLFVGGADGLEEDQVVLAHRYWQRRFGGDPQVVGRTIQVSGISAVVMGIAPDRYVAFGEGADLWMAMDMARGDQTNSGRWLYVVGRLEEGVSLDVARAELDGVATTLREEFPDFNAGWAINAVGLKADVIGEVRQPLWILMGAVFLLLFIACANVANLLLVRGTERQKEMAVRTSLGASGRRLLGQLLTESLTLAGIGSVLGVLLAYFGTVLLVQKVPDAYSLPRLDGATVDGTVLFFAVSLSLATGVFFGLIPAWRAAAGSPAATLNAEARGVSRGTGRLRNTLVTVEVAVSVVLLAGAALFGRSLLTLLAVDPGIEPDQVMVGRVTLSGPSYESDQQKVEFFQRLLGRLSPNPGIEAAGGVSFLPLDGSGAGTGYYPLDRLPPEPDDRPVADIRNVAGEYFQAMGIRLLEGRAFDGRDDAAGPRTAVVNRTLAETHWPEGNALGKPLFISWETEEPWEIVGVVEDVRMAGLDQEPRAVIYLSYPKTPYFESLQLALRAHGDPGPLAEILREEVRALDPSLPVGSLRTMRLIVDRSAARPRMTTFLMLIFAGLATLLAMVGLYGVLTYAVSRREREIGVRVAMGARPGDILQLVVRQGMLLVVVGLVMGLGLALFGGRLVGSLLYGIRPADPIALGGTGFLIFLVALVACVTPAWRAARTHPSEALRAE